VTIAEKDERDRKRAKSRLSRAKKVSPKLWRYAGTTDTPQGKFDIVFIPVSERAAKRSR